MQIEVEVDVDAKLEWQFVNHNEGELMLAEARNNAIFQRRFVTFGVAELLPDTTFGLEPMQWIVALQSGTPVAIRVETAEDYDYICVSFNVGEGITPNDAMLGDVFRKLRLNVWDYNNMYDEMRDAMTGNDTDHSHQWIFFGGNAE
jgi:hypothetical protein